MEENYTLRIIWGFKQKESEPQVKEIQTYKDIKSKTRNKKQPTIKAKNKKKYIQKNQNEHRCRNTHS